ncbi:MAG: 16S rRNA (guanine(527)-N(7))-methyltransferase RsmG [Rhodobacterales bacterium]|nr:16S rRNA (guanine(527)-N(7))-methyltransferase RsmG [Rhodobacterales bacterium]
MGPPDAKTRDLLTRRLGLTGADLDRLGAYLDLLEKWQARINLVGPATLARAWSRHVLDSAQLRPLIPPGAVVVDLGSGAGFPGLVLAALHDGPVHLVESDLRKGVFLAEANRLLGGRAILHNVRIEAADLPPADVVTARALAPLDRLLALARPLLAPGGKCLFPKGARADEELTACGKTWTMRHRRHASLSDADAAILEIEDFAPAHD